MQVNGCYFRYTQKEENSCHGFSDSSQLYERNGIWKRYALKRENDNNITTKVTDDAVNWYTRIVFSHIQNALLRDAPFYTAITCHLFLSCMFNSVHCLCAARSLWMFIKLHKTCFLKSIKSIAASSGSFNIDNANLAWRQRNIIKWSPPKCCFFSEK